MHATTAPPQAKVILHIENLTSANQGNVRSVAPDVPVDTPRIQQVVDIGGGLLVQCVLYDNHLFIGPMGPESPWYYFNEMTPNEGDDLATFQVVGGGQTKVVTRNYNWRSRSGYSYSWGGSHKTLEVEQVDCYMRGKSCLDYQGHYGFDPNSPGRLPYVYVNMVITAFGQTREVEMKFRLPGTGTVVLGDTNGRPRLEVSVDALGVTHSIHEDFEIAEDGRYTRHARGLGPLGVLYRHLRYSEIEGGKDALWAAFLGRWSPSSPPMDGLASLFKRKAFRPNFERLEKEQPIDWAFLRWLQGNVTDSGRKNNQLLGAFFKVCAADYDKMLAALQTARAEIVKGTTSWEAYTSGNRTIQGGHPATREACLSLPGAAEKVADQEAKKDFRKRKSSADQADGLLGEGNTYPKLRAAIRDGHIPIKVFNQPGKDGQPVNREFALWERALKQKGWAETIYEVCADASRRSTYERDITPWLNSLFTWPAYLSKHTEGRKKWTGKPKFVSSQWELEMNDDADDAEGPQKTVKERSAFTPWVDNENRILTIPYVAVCVTGVRAQWCYSRNFYLFEAGFTDPETGGIVVNDYEKNLNGQGDDYGLCYFTLTGTMTARGYPTFLIIFERRKRGIDQAHDPVTETFVHFHRVRPCRSKNSVKTPACELVERCYQYMAGNIPAKNIASQQGDLIFIKHGNDPIKAKAKVKDDAESGPAFEFESHRFVSDNPDVPLTLHLSAAKTPRNRLGFMHAPGGLSVRHPEHDNIVGLAAGWYEIRRCKSYENNPAAIWSLTID